MTSKKSIIVTVPVPVWRVFAKAAEVEGLTIPRFLEKSARECGSVVNIVAGLRRKIPAMKDSSPLFATSKNPRLGTIRPQVMKLLTSRGPMSIREIVDELEPTTENKWQKVGEHREENAEICKRRNAIRNVINQMKISGVLTINSKRVCELVAK